MLLEESEKSTPKTAVLKKQLDEIHKSFFSDLIYNRKKNPKSLSVKDAILLPRMKEYVVASEELEKVAKKAETLEKARALFQGKLRTYSGLSDSTNLGLVALWATTLVALLTKAFIPVGIGAFTALTLSCLKRKFAKDAMRKQMAISVIDTVLEKPYN